VLEPEKVLAGHDPGFEVVLALAHDAAAFEREEIRVERAVVDHDLVGLEEILFRGNVHCCLNVCLKA
jgi:hypothetical protein